MMSLTNAKLKLEYPSAENENAVDSPATTQPTTQPAQPRIRLWTKQSSESRNPNSINLSGNQSGDFMPPGTFSNNAVKKLFGESDTVTLYVEGLTCSGNVADARILATLYPDAETDGNTDGRKMEDAVRLTVMKLDLSICNGGSDLDNGDFNGEQGALVPDADEERVGAYLMVNWDDDDKDGEMAADGTWTKIPIPDLYETNTITNEDNLALLKPTIPFLPPNGIVELENSGLDADKVKLWEKSTKVSEITMPTTKKKTWDLSNAADKLLLDNFISKGYWMEGLVPSQQEQSCAFTLRYKNTGGSELIKDTGTATVVMINLANAVYRRNQMPMMNDRGHAALVWNYVGKCVKGDLLNDQNYLIIEMTGPTNNKDLTTTTQSANYPSCGCYTNPSITIGQRLLILGSANFLVNRAGGIIYSPLASLCPEHHWNTCLNTISALRCDGIVEVCYEICDVKVWAMYRVPEQNYNYDIADFFDFWTYTNHSWFHEENGCNDNQEEHNDWENFNWEGTLLPATQCGHVAPVGAKTTFQKMDLCLPTGVGSKGGN